MPAIKKAMNPILQAYDTEILNVIKQLHKSRREIWRKKKDGLIKEHAKNQHTAARREQVYIIFIFIFFL
jgi:hypothetical protein